MPNAWVGWQNWIKTANLTATSAALPASNVAEDTGNASLGWQTVNGVVTAGAGAILRADFAVPGSIVRLVCLARTNLTSLAQVSVGLWTLPTTFVAQTAVFGPNTGYGMVPILFSQNYACDYMLVSIDDPGNPDLHINVPLVFAGPGWNPLGGIGYSSIPSREDNITEVVSRGGQEYPTMNWQRRVWDITMDSIRASELYTQANELDRYCRSGTNILFIADSTTNPFYEAIMGRCRPRSGFSYPYQAGDRRRWSATISERL